MFHAYFTVYNISDIISGSYNLFIKFAMAVGIVLFFLVEKLVRYVEENHSGSGHHHHHHTSRDALTEDIST